MTHPVEGDPRSRREFLKRAGAAGAALAAGSLGLVGSCADPAPTLVSPHLPADAMRDGVLAIRNPLRLPPSVSPIGLTLTAAPGTTDLGGGQLSGALLFNGSFPGPTIRATTGDQATINFVNALAEGSIVHWHGLVVPHEDDGHPLQEVAPGGSYPYDFPIVQRASTNWYHPHPHMRTGKQVHQGLGGFFIINDAQEASLNLPSGPYEVPLLIRDARLDANGQLQYVEGTSGHVGPVMLVNGVRDATMNVESRRYRFRILCGNNTRIFTLALSNARQFILVGNDGGLLRTRTTTATITLGPAERVDVVVDFSALAVGTKVMLRATGSPPLDLLEFVVTQQVSVASPVPLTLSTIPIWQRSQAVRTRTFSFDGAMNINGRPYDINRIDFQVPFGDMELWRLTNTNSGPNVNHPVHVHGAYFQVLSRSGGRGRVFPWESGWKDTVLLQPGETVEILIRFDQYRGLYLLHCHRLEHEDMGMMANFEVI